MNESIDYPDLDPLSTGARTLPGTYASAWKPIQEAIARRVQIKPFKPLPRFVCGVDCAFGDDGPVKSVRKVIYAVAVVWDREANRVVDQAELVAPLRVPYIPTFLSFREGPALEAVIGKLTHPYGVICFDGQGIAHPRRCGVASHVGVRLTVPSVGIAKSVLCGEFDEPPPQAGATSPMVHRGEVIGVALRTRAGVKPIYVSVGHLIDLESATALALTCTAQYRIPEPTRLADIEVAKLKVRS